MIGTVVIAGTFGACVLGAGVKTYREEKRKREFPWTVAAERFRRHPSSRFNREAVTKKKKRFSLHGKIKSFSETLPLDEMVPILRQTESPIVAHFSPWEETEESEMALSAKRANEEPTGEDSARFQRHISKYWRPYWGVGLES